MIFNVWTFLFEVVNFLALAYVLHRLLYRPLQEAIDRRREANAKAQADAENARVEATALKQQLSTKLASIDEERQDLIRNARDQAEAERKATMAAAENDLTKRRQEAAQTLQEERTQALQSLHAELVQSAVALAERFLRESSSSTLQQQLAGRLVEELRQIPEGGRQRLRGELLPDDDAVVETASDLNGEIVQSIDGALESLAGRAVNLSVQTRPELLGGLRLRLGGHVWDATLTGVLREAAPTSRGRLAP
jgi:F-type H+-transporting ATPase subunit b